MAVPVTDGARVLGALRLALPLGAATSAYDELQRVMLAGGLVALMVAFGIGVFVAGRVTRPVVEMQAIARQMSEGQFAVRAPARSVDEIGALGRALNVMVAAAAREDRRPRGRASQGHGHPRRHGGGRHRGGRPRARSLLMNERARVMFGLGRAGGEGKPFLEVIRNADLHEIFRSGRTAAGGVFRRELRLTHPVERTLAA